MAYQEALARALDRAGSTSESWFDAMRPPRSALAGTEGMYVDRRQLPVRADPQVAFEAVRQAEDLIRWPSVNPLHLLRGRERSLPSDAWRVEWMEPGHLLRLAASRGMPGRAWLQFEVLPTERGAQLVQTAFFEPRGLVGLLYWFATYPLARRVFRRMLRDLARRAGGSERAVRTEQNEPPSPGAGKPQGERPPS